jgi:hypothetical protein
MHLPGDIILKVLKLPVSCYEPSCPPASQDFPPPFHFNYTAPLVRIVGEDGLPGGYVKAVMGMVEVIKAHGGHIFLNARVTDVVRGPGGKGLTLVFGNDRVVAERVLLNLPRHELLRLDHFKAALPARTVKMQQCTKFDVPDSLFPPGQKFDLGRSLTKAYAFYEEAWWHTRLNRTQGQLPDNAFVPLQTSVGIPIGIHFNDGPVKCDAPLVGCRGFLEVFYSPAGETFFEDMRPDPYHPLGILSADKDTKGQLARLHSAIMEATRPLFRAASKPQPSAAPSMLAVGVWDRSGEGYTAPTKVYYSTAADVPGGPDPLEKACGVPGLSDAEYRRTVLSPLPGLGAKVVVANNDWVAQTTESMFGDWAEESLLQAERGLRIQGVKRPQWLDAAYYNKKVLDVLTGDSVEFGRRPTAAVVV